MPTSTKFEHVAPASGEDMQNGVHKSVPVVKYVGHKVSKVRWKPQPSGAIESSDTFVSGSYEDEVGELPLGGC